MKEAMEEVREELGEDAFILHTKKYKEGGFLGYGSKDVVEVTAAIADEEVKKPPKKKAAEKKKTPAPKPAAPLLPPSVLSQYKTSGTSAAVEKAEKIAAPPSPIVPAQPPQPPQPFQQAEPFRPLQPTATTQPMQTIQPPQQAAPVFQNINVADIPAAANNPQTPPPAPAVLSAQPAENPVTAPSKVTAKSKRSKKARIIKAPQVAETVQKNNLTKKSENNRNIVEDVEGKSDDAKKIQRLEDELAKMKAILAQVMDKDRPKDVVPLQEALRLQEVESAIIEDLAGASGAGETMADWRTAEAKVTLRNFISQRVKYSNGIETSQKGPKIAALIGPTGVGKTTTLAKIAAKFVLEEGARTALITADTYRISAIEQLKTYSAIIGLPLEVVYSPEELRKAIRLHSNKDVILIDTAGRSQHNEFQMQELKELMRVNRRIEKHLVMSATTKNRDAADIVEKFAVCEPSRVIFTKTDETKSVGLILNLLYKKDIALSYLANGQSVPDDIMPANADTLTELLLRE